MQLGAFGPPEVLTPVERPDPLPGPGQVVVRMAATTVNPTDLSVRTGEVRTRVPDLTLPVVPGWDVSGAVGSVGPDVTRFQPGDRVVGLIPWRETRGRVGAYASAAVCEQAWLAPLATDCAIEDHHAATLPLNGLTAAQALEMAAVTPGSRILVTGAGGAVGGYAVQLAVAAGHEVVAMADLNDPWVHELGAHELHPRDRKPVDAGPVDAVIDAVPLDDGVVAAVRDGGRVVATRFPASRPRERGVEVHTVLVQPNAGQLADLVRALCAGRLRTRVAHTLPLHDAAEAHRLVEAGGLRGKVVLIPDHVR